MKDAYLIRVGLELTDGNAAATIVNAVVHSFVAYNGDYRQSKNSNLRKSLLEQEGKFKKEISDKREELK